MESCNLDKMGQHTSILSIIGSAFSLHCQLFDFGWTSRKPVFDSTEDRFSLLVFIAWFSKLKKSSASLSIVLRRIGVRKHCQYFSFLKCDKILELSCVATRYNTVYSRCHSGLSDLSHLLRHLEQMFSNAVIFYRDTSVSSNAFKNFERLTSFPHLLKSKVYQLF